jgi:hypothetical protein
MRNFKVVLDIEADEAKWASDRNYDLGDLWNGTVKADLMDYIESSVQLAYPDSAVEIHEINVEENLEKVPEGYFV